MNDNFGLKKKGNNTFKRLGPFFLKLLHLNYQIHLDSLNKIIFKISAPKLTALLM